MENKLAVLSKCISRVARVAPLFTYAAGQENRSIRRFVGLWQARNRRTRVLMARQREVSR